MIAVGRRLEHLCRLWHQILASHTVGNGLDVMAVPLFFQLRLDTSRTVPSLRLKEGLLYPLIALLSGLGAMAGVAKHLPPLVIPTSRDLEYPAKEAQGQLLAMFMNELETLYFGFFAK
jgi:hypothetical protein